MNLTPEILTWVIFNAVALAIVSHDLWDTHRIWRWAQLKGDVVDKAISFRSFRLSISRFIVSLSFMTAGVLASIQIMDPIVWFLIAGAGVLAYDAIADFKYRKQMFRNVTKRELSESTKETLMEDDN